MGGVRVHSVVELLIFDQASFVSAHSSSLMFQKLFWSSLCLQNYTLCV